MATSRLSLASVAPNLAHDAAAELGGDAVVADGRGAHVVGIVSRSTFANPRVRIEADASPRMDLYAGGPGREPSRLPAGEAHRPVPQDRRRVEPHLPPGK